MKCIICRYRNQVKKDMCNKCEEEISKNLKFKKDLYKKVKKARGKK